jgi:hypothetical protein
MSRRVRGAGYPGGFESYFEELIALIEQTGGLPPEEELRELGIAHGSIPA